MEKDSTKKKMKPFVKKLLIFACLLLILIAVGLYDMHLDNMDYLEEKINNPEYSFLLELDRKHSFYKYASYFVSSDFDQLHDADKYLKMSILLEESIYLATSNNYNTIQFMSPKGTYLYDVKTKVMIKPDGSSYNWEQFEKDQEERNLLRRISEKKPRPDDPLMLLSRCLENHRR